VADKEVQNNHTKKTYTL